MDIDRKKAIQICFTNNVFVILALLAAVLSAMIIILWTIKPTIVLDNTLYRIEYGRIFLVSLIVACIIVVVMWILSQYHLSKN